MIVDSAPRHRPCTPRWTPSRHVRPGPGIVAYRVRVPLGMVSELMRGLDSLGVDGAVPYCTEVDPSEYIPSTRTLFRVDSVGAFLRLDAVMRDRWCVEDRERCE